jgi:hypothetical protein
MGYELMADKYADFLEELDTKFALPTAPTTAPLVPPVPDSKYGSILQDLDQQFAATAVTETVVTPTAMPTNYSENDLTQDQFFLPIQNYMVDRFGEHIKDLDREDVIGKYTNNMRGFEGGNSVRTVNEVVYLNEIGDDEERMAKAGEAYKIYQGMQGVFGDTTLGEKAETVWDFTRSAVADPINVLGLGVGKVATGTGFRAGSQLALIAAKRAYEKALVKGVTKEAALETGQKVLARAARTEVQKTNARIAQRQAVEQTAKTTLQRMTTNTALKEAAIMGTFEAAVSAGTDYLYQDVMLRTKVQDEYSVFQTGLSAVVGLVAGGLAGAASNVGTGASGLKAPNALKKSVKGNKVLGQLLTQTATPSPAQGNWLADIAKGKELKDQDTEFFITMLLGNDEKGLKGLAQILAEDGYTWIRRSPDDKVSNWIGDVIKDADPQDAKQFLKDFTTATGIKMSEGKKLTVEALADTFKRKLSDSAKVMNAASQVSAVLGGNLKGKTVDDYVSTVIGGGGYQPAAVQTKIGKFVDNNINRNLPDLQNNIIRLMVSNLSTTAMNVTGYAAMTSLNSTSDVARAVLMGGKAGLYLAYNPAEAKKAGITALNILQNQKAKVQNILDINTTYDQFIRYSQSRPEAMRPLTALLPGGVEDLEKASKSFDPETPLLTLQANQVVDLVQRAALGSAQDALTKSVEFFSQLDKGLRRSRDEGGFGMSYNEFMSDPKHTSKMISEQYLKIEARAIDETLKSVFAKSYKGEGFVGEVAGVIEDARTIPGIGLLVPFGRFFNNTVALAYETTAIGPLLSRIGGKTDDKPFSETFIRGAVTWGLIGTLAQREQGYIDLGLGWSEEIDEETGAVIDERYEFPYGLYKALGRTVAHLSRGEGIPSELGLQFAEQFGVDQLTRQLGDAGSGLGNIANALLSEEGPDLAKVLQEALGGIASQAISGATRPLEPINALIGLGRNEEFYVPDRKQGAKAFNNAIRYIDQGFALFSGNTMPPAFSAAEGQPRQNISKLVSTTRESRLTATEQVMNSIGRPSWKANMASESEAADNRYNQLYNQIIENGAAKLFASERFKKGDLESKQLAVTDLLQKAAKATKTYMGSIAAKSGDRALLKMIQISNAPKVTIQRVLADLGISKGLDELSEEELDTVANAIKFREDIVKAKNE